MVHRRSLSPLCCFLVAVGLFGPACNETDPDRKNDAGDAQAGGGGAPQPASGGESGAGTGGSADTGGAGTSGAGEAGSGGGGGAPEADPHGGAGAGGAPSIEPPTTSYRYVINTMRAPIDGDEFSADVDGDGDAENAYGQILMALNPNAEFDTQGAWDEDLDHGNVELIALQNGDPSFMKDPWAAVTLHRGTQLEAGNTPFAIDSDVPSTTLAGNLTSGVFASDAPAQGQAPASLPLRIYLGEMVEVNLVGPRITFQPSSTELVAGQINGGLLKTEVESVIYPALARTVSAITQEEPCDSRCNSMRTLLDTNKDKLVDTAEIAASPTLQNVFAPDLKLLDESGDWAPNFDGTEKDAISVGIGFSAYATQF